MPDSSPTFDFWDNLLKDNPRRCIECLPTSRWGRLVEPTPEEKAQRPASGLRILVLGSWTLGLLAFEGLLELEKTLPGKARIVGLVTDDPHDPNAKISIHRRFWRYYDQAHREDYEWGILHRALAAGVACYTGEIKCDGFRALLAQWDPEAIVSAAFGQIVDEPIIDYPAYGIYNVHPSDLLRHYGAGPHPWEDLAERKATSMRVTLHKVSQAVDGGDVVGQSTEVNLTTVDGQTTDNVRVIGEKTLVPVKAMVEELIRALAVKKEAKQPGPVNTLDFADLLPQALQHELLAPLDPSAYGRILPLPDDEKIFTV